MFIQFVKIQVDQYDKNSQIQCKTIPIELIQKQVMQLANEKVDNIHIAGVDPFMRDDIWNIIEFIQLYEFERIRCTVNFRSITPEIVSRLLLSHIYFIEFDFNNPEIELELNFFQFQKRLAEASRAIKMIKKQKIHKNLGYTAYVQMNFYLKPFNYKKLNKIVETGFKGLADVIEVSHDYRISYYRLARLLNNAIQISLKHHGLVFFRNIPMCILVDNEYFCLELYQKSNESGKLIHTEVCDKCKFVEICGGIDQRYLDLFGEQMIHPVEDTQQDLSSLHDLVNDSGSWVNT